MTSHHDLLHWIPIERTGNLILVASLLLEISLENLSKLKCVPLACAEVQLNDFTLNSFKKSLNELCADILSRNVETQRINTPVQYVKGLGVSFFGIGSIDFLSYIPFIVVFLVSTYKWELTRKCLWCFQLINIFLQIERLYIEALVCTPNETFVKVGSLQVFLNFVKPFLACGRLKLAKELFFVIRHSV